MAHTVHLFWAYGDFSQLERLCARSFVAHGHRVALWTYGGVGNAPPGVDQRDAREVFPEDRVFTYRNGSYSAFSNLFRYAVLSRYGGLYSDTDVVCLLPAERLPAEPFLVSERMRKRPGVLGVNPNLIWHPDPRPGDLVDLALAIAERFPVSALEWGDCGPKLLTMLCRNYRKLAPRVMPPGFANPVDWWECPGRLLSDRSASLEGVGFLHCYNETWRRAGVDKDAPYPAGSLMEKAALRVQALAGPAEAASAGGSPPRHS